MQNTCRHRRGQTLVRVSRWGFRRLFPFQNKWSKEVRREQTGKFFHNPSKQHIHLWTKGDWIIPQQRSVATWYCDTPRRAFVTLSTPFKSRIILFYLPRRPAEWKIFPSFSISSLLLTPRTLFAVHLLSNLSPLKDFYFYLLWHSKGPLTLLM